MNIYLFRHGKTIANEQHLYCGSTDLPLSPNSVATLQKRASIFSQLQTKAFPASCSKTNSIRFISSGMKRCNETMELLFGVTDYEIISDFCEINFGIFEMKSYEQLKDNPDYQMWICGDNFHNIPPQGESGAKMTARILPAFQTILDRQQDTVIVTHGGVISAIMQHLFPDENKNIYQWQPKPGFGYKITKQVEECTYEKIDEFYTGR